MMSRYLIAAALLCAPAGLAAQTTVDLSRGRLDIIGTANPACVIRTPTQAAGNNMSFNASGATSGQIAIAQFVDNNAVPRGGSIEVSVPVVCNSAHRLTVRSGAGGLRLQGATPPSAGFAQSVSYRVGTVWGDQQAGFTSEIGNLVIDTAEARAGQVSLSIDVASGGQPLVAGIYSDQIVLELQPAS